MSGEIDKSDDEPFFARWSRKKQQAKPVALRVDEPIAPPYAAPEAHPVMLDAPAATEPADAPSCAITQPKPMTEDDFKDVDFSVLDYGSDYDRFMQDGVPEGIRQKALTKLWHSDPIFTQVDPFQDYAGDYTDAAVVPLGGVVRTAYKIGQGFLSDAEAHEWHRLGKPALAAEIAALPVLVPGYRVRPATAEDGDALLAVHRSASIVHLANSQDLQLTLDDILRDIQLGVLFEAAIDEETAELVAFCGARANAVTHMFVHARHGRKGLGRSLLQRAMVSIRDAGFDEASFGVFLEARAFYERQGFSVTSELVERRVCDVQKCLIMPADLSIARETADQPEVHAFLAASEAYASALYPAESNHFVDVATLMQPNVVFLVVRGAGRALGCGAIVKSADGTAELKRMWVAPEARGLKLGQRLLDALIDMALTEGVAVLRLETGISQPEALGLYRRAGFVEIGPFGDYKSDPLSVFMERPLAA